jgi:cell wall-associated NlpC family hydrolase
LGIPSIMLYRAKANINLYDSSELKALATQALADRFIRLAAPETIGDGPLKVIVVEDDYPGWLVTAAEIADRLPAVMAFAQAALAVPNEYLWGGTVAPNYDCSGLIQAAFISQGIQLPRDAYQQEGFVRAVPLRELIPGDLVFFGPPEKATHVGLYLGENRYIHSSGSAIGNNGIAINALTLAGSDIDRNYFSQWRTGGRVTASYKSRLG